MFNKKIGILHNKYLIKGGEDEVCMNEYKLLKNGGLEVQTLLFDNPEVGYKAILQFLFSIFNIGSFIKTYRWIKKNNIEVLHIHNWFYQASPSVIWAAKVCKVPVVITLHNYRMLCPSGTLSFNGQPYLKSLHSDFPWDAIKKGVYRNSKFQTLWLVLIMWSHQKAGTWRIPKAYIVLTQNSLEIFKKSKPIVIVEKIFVKPNFVEDILTIHRPQRLDTFLYVGRLSQEKGIAVLLEAFAKLPYQLNIIGDGPLKGEVKEYCKSYLNIKYSGFQPKPVILKELSQSSALIFPSIWLETFGLTIIEAFATGTPVIASNQGSASLLIKDGYNGLHFIPENVPDMQRIITKWSNFSKAEKDIFSANARRSYEENYTPEKNLHQLIHIYEKSLDKI